MNIEELHIGDWIRKVAVEQDVSVSELARRIGMSRQNLANKLKNDSWDVKELFAVSQELNYNFFSLCLKPIDLSDYYGMVLNWSTSPLIASYCLDFSNVCNHISYPKS